MFTIDLLKGQGIPAKTKPQGLALFAATFVVPVVIAIGMFGYYVRNGVIMGIQKEAIAGYEAKMVKYADAIKMQQSYENEKNAINSCLQEVSASIRQHIQWSPILVTIVENMPDSVVLTKLEVKWNSIKKKVAVKGDPQKKVDTSVPVRTLKMTVSGDPQLNCEQEVRAFRDRLRLSSMLGPIIEDIVIVSQGYGKLDGRDVVSYEIDCIFKPES
jgi:hypothetical protein